MANAAPLTDWQRLHEAAWPDLFTNLQTAYAELTQAQFELERRAGELSEARDLFQQVVESMSEALFLLDRAGHVLQANPAAGRLLGRAAAELAGCPFAEVWPAGDVPATPWRLLERAPDGTLTDLEVQFPARAGPISLNLSCGLVRDKRGRITGVLVIARDVTGQKRAEEHLRASLHEKELLLKEIHHRVKNNLQIISSLLNLQGGSVKDPATLQALRESQNRVRSMALIHEKLYQSRDLGRIDFGRYTRDLAGYLLRSYGPQGSVTLSVEIEQVFLGIDSAIPCGLIINELVSNCLKHAFPAGREGEVRVTLCGDPGDGFTLVVSDNGVGLPEDLDPRSTESLGLQLVHTLAAQLGGTLELERKPGTTFKLSFPAAPTKGLRP